MKKNLIFSGAKAMLNKNMPFGKFTSAFVIVLMTTAIMLASCGGDDDDAKLSLQLTKQEFVNGETINVSVSLASSDWSIENVDFYFDGQHFGKALYGANMEIDYSVEEGNHQIKAIAHCSNGSSQKDIEGTTIVNVSKPIFRFDFNIMTIDGKSFKNGEPFLAVVESAKENNVDAKITKVVFNWDGKKIAEVKSEPFQLEYTPKGQTVGKHILNYHIYYSSTNALYKSGDGGGYDYPIELVE